MFRVLDQPTESRKRRGAAFLCGLLAQGVVIGAAVFLGILFPGELPIGDQRYTRVWLAALKPPERPALDPPRPKPHVTVPRLRLPKVPSLELPRMTAHLDPPRIQPTIPPPPVHEVSLPAAPPVQPVAPPKEHVEVRTGLFGGGAQEPVTTKRPIEQVQTGGFGSPQGLSGRAQGDSPGDVPKLGAFGLPEGPGHGNGTGGAHGVQGVVASAGFGSGIAGAGYERGGVGTETPKVALGGFEKAPPVAPSQAHVQASKPAPLQPVEILSKPTPAYTEEARRAGIQGEVTLSVVFEATGTLRVLGVVKSLGHGLDEAAEQAATQIRYKPALREGKPADFPATLRIEFRLANQST